MVATVYTPNGIVVATASYDSFHEHLDTEDGIQISPINIEGLTHTYLFTINILLTFNGLNSYTIEFEILDKFEELSKRWGQDTTYCGIYAVFKETISRQSFSNNRHCCWI